MSSTWNGAQLSAALIGVGLLLVLDVVLSVAMVSVSALSRVALRRLSSESASRLDFLEHMQHPPSPHRSAAILLRQWSLLGATLLLVLAAQGAGWTSPTAVGVVFAAVVGVLLFESLIARSVALWNPRRALRATAGFVRLAYVLLFPVVVPLQWLFEWVGSNPQRTVEEIEEDQEREVEALIEVGERSGLLEAAEGEMMRGIVDLDETLVREIMTPRTNIVAISSAVSVAEARRALLEAGHSRIPVYSETIDDVIGVLHSRDLFQAWEDHKESAPVSHYLRAAIFVPETLSAADLLAEMREKTPIALVVDEYGGVAGLVTLEDILEEIVGEIRDEHEPPERLLVEESTGIWNVDATAHVEELESLFSVDFGERDFDTVGGLVIWDFGRVPKSGETLETHGLHVEVLIADDRRVKRVRVKRAPPPSAEASSAR